MKKLFFTLGQENELEQKGNAVFEFEEEDESKLSELAKKGRNAYKAYEDIKIGMNRKEVANMLTVPCECLEESGNSSSYQWLYGWYDVQKHNENERSQGLANVINMSTLFVGVVNVGVAIWSAFVLEKFVSAIFSPFWLFFWAGMLTVLFYFWFKLIIQCALSIHQMNKAAQGRAYIKVVFSDEKVVRKEQRGLRHLTN